MLNPPRREKNAKHSRYRMARIQLADEPRSPQASSSEHEDPSPSAAPTATATATIADGKGKHVGKISEQEQKEQVVFDNLQTQDDNIGADNSVLCGGAGGDDDDDGLKGPSEFVLDDCVLGSGFVELIKSMTKCEQCEAWLAPKYGPLGERETPSGYHMKFVK